MTELHVVNILVLEDEQKNMIEPLQEYVRYMDSVKSAFARRLDKMKTCYQAFVQLESRQQYYDKIVLNQQNSDQIKIAERQADIDVYQKSFDDLLRDFQIVSWKLMDDFVIFKHTMFEDLKHVFNDYVNKKVSF